VFLVFSFLKSSLGIFDLYFNLPYILDLRFTLLSTPRSLEYRTIFLYIILFKTITHIPHYLHVIMVVSQIGIERERDRHAGTSCNFF